MQIFIYEWVIGGGFLDRADSPPESLLREGAVMLEAVAKDFFKLPGVVVKTIVAEQIGPLPFVAGMPSMEPVASGAARDKAFDDLVSESDAAIVIAPEFEGILLRLTTRVANLGGRLLSPGREFVEVVSDKHLAACKLQAAGVATPFGLVVMPGEMCPAHFVYPAVLKPIDGAGSLGIVELSGPRLAPTGAGAYRLEQIVPGVAASVSMLCGGGIALPLEPCTQRLVGAGDYNYLGGELPLPSGLRDRARRLGTAALAVLPDTTGYVGVDLVLGEAADGSGDAVIEINPRYTTSYVGLRAATDCNLAELMLALAGGEPVTRPNFTRGLEFDASGEVRLH